ncbi:hypothetical protein CARUB_v10019674mg [Capsella rubella]|uniref:Uncharacterized protein n=1 Tax=Capsella rubella TaxID=81985 RepID=R0I589_9BRAS|nr:uncharacterized protein LOC17895362 isoform X2 [Capsella rubella]EOA33195.1 hypothetical protein CARUB_v10019674mg [Capsella rubella]
MEKRLRSSLKTSADEFISTAVKLTLKSSKPSLKTIIYSVKPSSDLSSSLPLALHNSILQHTESFQNLVEDDDTTPSVPSPSDSPPRKRQRGNGSEPDSGLDSGQRKHQILGSLQVLSHVVHLCLLNPKKAFSTSDLLPAAQILHNNLRLFESDSVLCLEIAGICECWWKEGFVGRESLISQSLPFLLSRSLTLKKKVDVHRVYMLREAFTLFDFEDESIEDLRMLLMRCVVSPLYLKTEDGQKFVSFAFGLSRQLMKAGLAVVKAQIPLGRKSVLEGFGGILFRAWKEVEQDLKGEIEDGFLQGIIDSSIHASSCAFAASLRRVLGGFISQRTTQGVEKLLFSLAEPMIFRSLQVANSNVRLNALHLLLDLFPMEDPDATKEAKDTLLDKQFYLLEKLMSDECPDVRSVAVEGLCRVFYLFWEVIPSATITKVLTKIFDDMSHESCSEVRLSTVNGISYLLANPQSHGILKVVLPRLGHLMLDSVTSVRVAMVDLLLLLRDVRAFQFNTVVSLDVLLSVLASDQTHVAKGIARLLIPSYFPSRKRAEEASQRCRTLINRKPMAGARFCEFLVSLGATVQSVLHLVGFFLNSILSGDKLEENQTEGLFRAAYYLCKDLVADSECMASLKELLPGEKLKSLLDFAPTAQAKSSVIDIIYMVSPDIVSDVLEDCMNLVVSCGGLPGDAGRQTELRSVHKLLLSSNAFCDLIGTFTKIMQKTAYRCQINFGYEVERKNVHSRTRKKSKSAGKSSARWKHVSGKHAISFEDDYMVAVGIAWQINDLLTIEDARKAILESDIEELLLALKVVSQTSILQATCCKYMDVYPVLAYTSLALHVALQNVNTDAQKNDMRIAEDIVDQTMDHILDCTEELFQAGDSGTPGTTSPEANLSMQPTTSKGNQLKRRRSNAGDDDAFEGSKEGGVLNKFKMLTAILKFFVEYTEMGLASHFQARMLKFTSAYLKYTISIWNDHSTGKLQFEDADMKEMILCTKSSTSYIGKFVNLVMRHATKASRPLFEAFDLANDLLDLFTTVEISLGSAYASKLVTTLNPWIPDLVLALGPCFISNSLEEESSYTSSFNHIKFCFPSWLFTFAKIELLEINKEDETSESHLQFPAFKRVRNTIVSLVKGNSKVVDGIGYFLLICSAVCIEKKDFSTALGLLNFVCMKLVSREDREWRELDTMLVLLPRIYPIIEREIGEESDEDVVKKLEAARDLLQPVWMYHVYETRRFRMMEEEEEE